MDSTQEPPPSKQLKNSGDFTSLSTVQEEEDRQIELNPDGVELMNSETYQALMHAQQKASEAVNTIENLPSICCRNSFVHYELLKHPQKNIFFKKYLFKLNRAQSKDFVHTFCALFNTKGGQIMIGITWINKQTGLVTGHLFSEKDKQQVKKQLKMALYKYSSFPLHKIKVKVDFIPLERNPRITQDFEEYLENEKFASTKQLLTLKSQCIPAAYVIKVRVPQGSSLPKYKLVDCREENEEIFPIENNGNIELLPVGQKLLSHYQSQIEHKPNHQTSHTCVQIPKIPFEQVDQVDYLIIQQWNQRQKKAQKALKYFDDLKYGPTTVNQVYQILQEFKYKKDIQVQSIKESEGFFYVRIQIKPKIGKIITSTIQNDLRNFFSNLLVSESAQQVKVEKLSDFAKEELENDKESQLKQQKKFYKETYCGILYRLKKKVNTQTKPSSKSQDDENLASQAERAVD